MNYLVVLGFTLFWTCCYAQSTSARCTTPLGVQSQCVSLYDCPSLLNAFEQRPLPTHVVNFLRESQCGFNGYIPSVCCGPIPNDQINSVTTKKPVTSPTFSGSVDPVNSEDSYPTPRDQCGIDTNGDRIYGGQFTDLDEFPWMALLGYRPANNGPLTYQCGGVLINHRYVLTAAHCLVGEIESAVGKLTSARLGEYDTQNDIDCVKTSCADPVQEIAVHSAYPHEGFTDKSKNRHDDIGLVRLASRAKFTYYVQPICLASSDSRVNSGSDVFVAGWGKTLEGRSSPIKLKLSLPISNKSNCVTKYRTLGAELTDKQICAGGVFAQDACRGDSGGPLMRNAQGTWETVAVVSFGYGCGRDGWPGVYSSVASYRGWIENTLRSTNV